MSREVGVWGLGKGAERGYRGISLIRKRPPHQDHQRALGIVLLQGRRGALFRMSEVPLYDAERERRFCKATDGVWRGKVFGGAETVWA